MSVSIDLNADLGELPGAEGRASDAAILGSVTSCAIACGGHAGDEATMKATLLSAKKHGVAAGAHPAYPDRKNFGRLSMDISAVKLGDTLRDQMQTLQSLAQRTDVPLTHVKPHGALYNDGAQVIRYRANNRSSNKVLFWNSGRSDWSTGSGNRKSGSCCRATFSR